MSEVRFSDGSPMSFSTLSVTRSIENAFGQAQWSTYEDGTGRLNTIIEIRENNGLRFRGYFEISDGNQIEGFSCSARSLAVQLDQVEASGAETFRSTNLATIARALAQRAGVTIAEVPSRQVNRFRLERGESYRQAMQRLAEVHRVVITDDAAGRVRVFALPDAVVPRAVWREGAGSVTKAIRRRLDYSDWRTEWECRGSRVVVDAEGDLDIGFLTTAGLTRPSRRVLPNRAATSRADAAAMLDWAAKTALARTISVEVTHLAWPAEPGDVVQVVAPELGIDEVMVVQSIQADLVRHEYVAVCVFPDVYLAKPLPRQRATRPSEWKIAQGPVTERDS